MVASPEVIAQVIRSYREAATANRQTAARRGNLIVLSPDVADEVIVEDQDVVDATVTQSMESMYQTLRGTLPHKNGRL